MNTDTNYTVHPFHHIPSNKFYNRLLVKPHRTPEIVHDNGLVTPAGESKLCDVGTVYAVSPDSTFKKGDEIEYAKIDRAPGEHLDSVSIDGEEYDVIFENEVWSVNDHPHNRIFAIPVTNYAIGEEQLVIDKHTKNITQKAIIHSCPPQYGLKPGDRIEYRKPEGGMNMEAIVNNQLMHVLFEGDIFLVNDKAAPYRIVIKIDMAAQRLKRTSAEGGLVRSPLFIAMLHNLQYAEVMDIGVEAQKMYPDLKVGDTAIIHHSIESQAYRLIGKKDGAHGTPLYEYRIINCWEEKAREIFGKVFLNKDRKSYRSVKPLNKNIFCEWTFEPLEEISSDNPYLDIMGDLRKYKNLEEFKSVLAHKKAAAAEKAKQKISGIKNAMNMVDTMSGEDKVAPLRAELIRIQREETATVQALSKNHLLILTKFTQLEENGTMSPDRYLICTHEELYPINILGRKFIIAHPDFVIASTNKSMNVKITDIRPKKGIIFVRPIIEEATSGLVVPEAAREKPSRGLVAAFNPEERYFLGEEVLFRKHAGLEQEIGGDKYLILKENDVLAQVNTSISESENDGSGV